MNLDDQVPVSVGHVLEANIPQDARIVEQDIYPAEFLDGSLDDVFAILDTVIIRNCFAASSSNLLDDYISGLDKKVSRSRLSEF